MAMLNNQRVTHGDVPHRCYFAPPLRHLFAARGAVSQLEPSSRAARFGHEESISWMATTECFEKSNCQKNVVDWGMYTYIYTHTYLYLIYIEREIHGGIDWDWYVMMS